MFSDTLQGPYLIAGCTSTFSHLVVVGERIERGLKMGNIQDVAIASEFPERIDEDASTIFEDEEEAPAYPQFQILNQVTKANSNLCAPQICVATICQTPVQHAPQQQNVPRQQTHRRNCQQRGGKNLIRQEKCMIQSLCLIVSC